MLLRENFTEKHIKELQKSSNRDPILLERAVYAYGLLEALARVEMPFIFKGGTCLMLLMERPQRLSTDIDIIVRPGTDLDKYLRKASEIFPFQQVEERKRIGTNKIEKRHFKFTYNSPINNRPFFIFLDVLFVENHYEELVMKEIRNELLLTTPEYLLVSIPSADCILADKLTAFAPNTTGIPLNKDRAMEVIKQLYDVCSLLDIFTDYQKVRNTYTRIAKAEIAYRGIDKTPEDCLQDTFDAALCIASRGKVNVGEYPLYVRGIRNLRGHIYSEYYTPEIAAGRATKVLFMTACLLTGTDYVPVSDYREYVDQRISSERLMPLRYLRKVNPEAYAYTIKTDGLLSSF